jgi:DNA invertase Pin-like site-specific DNA recombinase
LDYAGVSVKINYNSETREQVIKLVLKNEKSAHHIAKELGIGPNTVGRWVNEYRKDHSVWAGDIICVKTALGCMYFFSQCHYATRPSRRTDIPFYLT